MVDRTTALPEGEKILVLSPVIREKRENSKKKLKQFQKEGFSSGRV